MRKRLLTAWLALVMALSFTPCVGSTAFAGIEDGPYCATVKYFDGVQISYALNYPSGGLWTGAADIPVGGMGSGSQMVSGQIYCVDPFTPFHSRADDSYWNSSLGATVDIKDGYLYSPPWVVSPALSQSYDAVRWLVLNGYRGDYLQRASDSESQASVTRLRSLYVGNPSYPGVTVVDETIALMATKVSIWKVLVGDHLTVMNTSLDGDAARRASFDALVDAMLADALAGRATGEVMTVFNLELSDQPSFTQTDADATYEVYGPLTISAWLTASSSALALDKVFLTASGIDAADVVFIAGPGVGDAVLSTDTLYATSVDAQFLAGSAFADAGGGVLQAEVYLRVPVGRALDADRLTVKAYARADSVALAAGTPVTFAYGDGGVVDWEAVQAFIGAAGEGMLMDLFSDATLYTGDTALGDLWVAKVVDDATPLDQAAVFSFRLLHSGSSGGPFSPVALSEPLSGGPHPVYGALSVSGDTFTLRAGGMVHIEGLAGDSDDFYIIEETSLPGGYHPPDFAVQLGVPLAGRAGCTLVGGGYQTAVFQLDPDLDCMALVSLYNARDAVRGLLYVGKVAVEVSLDGTVFSYLTSEAFDYRLEAYDDEGGWQPVDLAGVFASDGGAVLGDPADGCFRLGSLDLAYIEVDPYRQYRVIELAPGAEYLPMFAMIIYRLEADGSYSETAASSMDGPWLPDQEGSYTVEGIEVDEDGYAWLVFSNLRFRLCDLTLAKQLAGEAVTGDGELLFAFQVVNNVQDTLLPYGEPLLLGDGTQPGAYAVVGVDASRIVEDADGNPTILELKAGESATIAGLPAGEYRVVELGAAGFAASYSLDGAAALPAEGGSTPGISLDGDAELVFFNARAGGGGGRAGDDEGRQTAATGDAASWLLAGSAALAAGGAALLATRRRRRAA